MHVLCFYSSVDHIMLSKCCTISTFVFINPHKIFDINVSLFSFQFMRPVTLNMVLLVWK